jgi:hypothetical protein
MVPSVGLSAAVIGLTACSASNGGNGASPTKSQKTFSAPIRDANADGRGVGYESRPGQVGQWFKYRDSYAARIAKVEVAQPGDISDSAQQDGPYSILTIEVKYIGDRASGNETTFELDTDAYHEAVCTDPGRAKDRNLTIRKGELATLRFCGALDKAEGNLVTLTSYLSNSEDVAAVYSVSRPS